MKKKKKTNQITSQESKADPVEVVNEEVVVETPPATLPEKEKGKLSVAETFKKHLP